MKKTKYEWEQLEVIHCPEIHCQGMLLQCKYLHEMKCSRCKKYFMEFINYLEVKKPKELELL